MNRRNFIKTGSLVAGTFTLPFNLFSQHEKINLALLGTGWWGTEILLENMASSGLFNIIGLCDVNSVSLGIAANRLKEKGLPEPQLFSDYQEMYNMGGLEAVAIATPTHWHALQFIDACEKGLHVFLEKPISYDIREGQAMIAAQKRAKNVVQVDFPRLMVDTNAQVKEFIQSGEAGKILQVQANINGNAGVLVEKEIPDTIDFDTFCGPAPKVNYLCNKNNDNPLWRGQHVFSRGIMADWGIHYLHNVRQVLDLELPGSVSAVGGTTKNFTHDNPDHLEVQYDFNGLPVRWSHKNWGFVSPEPKHDIGVFYFGEKATIFAGDLGWEVYPTGSSEVIAHGDVRFKPFDNQATYMKMCVDLFTEFAMGIKNKSNEGLTNPLIEAYKTTSMINYGDIAFRSETRIEIDGNNMDIVNNKLASSMLKRDYQSSYKHPFA